MKKCSHNSKEASQSQENAPKTDARSHILLPCPWREISRQKVDENPFKGYCQQLINIVFLPHMSDVRLTVCPAHSGHRETERNCYEGYRAYNAAHLHCSSPIQQGFCALIFPLLGILQGETYPKISREFRRRSWVVELGFSSREWRTDEWDQ